MFQIAVGSLGAAVALFLGSLFPLARAEHSKGVLHRLMSFGSGVLLGTAFIHLLPEAASHSTAMLGIGLAASFLFIFGIEQVTLMHACYKYYHECRINPGHFHRSVAGQVSFLAFLIHSLLDGLALAASFKISVTLGLAASFAVLVHQFPIGISLTSIFLHSQYTKQRILISSLLIAISIPAAALGVSLWLKGISPQLLSLLLAFSAGSFIFIGATDILPEVHEEHDMGCYLFFAVGMIAMFLAKSV